MPVTHFRGLCCQSPRQMAGDSDVHSWRRARAALQAPPPAACPLPRQVRAPPRRPLTACPAISAPVRPRRVEGTFAPARQSCRNPGRSLKFPPPGQCLAAPHTSPARNGALHMAHRQRERQAAFEAPPAHTSRAIFRAHALGCTVGYGSAPAFDGRACRSGIPAWSGSPLSGTRFARQIPHRLPIRLARSFARTRWGVRWRTVLRWPSTVVSAAAVSRRGPGVRFQEPVRAANPAPPAYTSRAYFRVRTLGVSGAVRIRHGRRRAALCPGRFRRSGRPAATWETAPGVADRSRTCASWCRRPGAVPGE